MCGRVTEFISLEDAADTTERSMRELVHLAESGQVHFAESRQGYLAICESSLPRKLEMRTVEDVA